MGYLRKILKILSLVVLVFANAGGIGCFLYLWKVVGVGIGLASLTVFKIWIILSFLASIIFAVSIFRVKI